jgi:hypothetical protein
MTPVDGQSQRPQRPEYTRMAGSARDGESSAWCVLIGDLSRTYRPIEALLRPYYNLIEALLKLRFWCFNIVLMWF